MCFFKADWSGSRTQRTSTYQWVNSMWPHMVFFAYPPEMMYTVSGGYAKKTI